MNKVTNVGRCSVEENTIPDSENPMNNREVVPESNSAHEIEGHMSDQDATVTITKNEWQKLMTMLHTLSANQAELSKNQAELISQLARANERVKELEEKNEKLRAENMSPQRSESLGVRQEKGGSKTLSRSPSFQYTSKGGPFASKPGTRQALKEGIQVRPKKTWAQIAAEKRPSVNDVSKETQERLRKCLAMLDIQSPQPKPTALYFRNIRRARLGQVRKALRQMFTHPWAVLGLSFIGKSVVEIVCHESLVDQVVAKLRLVGASHIKNLNVFGDNMKKLSQKDQRNRFTLNLERAHQRFERLVQTCTNSAAKMWYTKQAQEAERRLAEMYQIAHDVETSVSDDSGYESNEVDRDETMSGTEGQPECQGKPEEITSSPSPTDIDTDEIQPIRKDNDLAREAPLQH